MACSDFQSARCASCMTLFGFSRDSIYWQNVYLHSFLPKCDRRRVFFASIIQLFPLFKIEAWFWNFIKNWKVGISTFLNFIFFCSFFPEFALSIICKKIHANLFEKGILECKYTFGYVEPAAKGSARASSVRPGLRAASAVSAKGAQVHRHACVLSFISTYHQYF